MEEKHYHSIYIYSISIEKKHVWGLYISCTIRSNAHYETKKHQKLKLEEAQSKNMHFPTFVLHVNEQ